MLTMQLEEHHDITQESAHYVFMKLGKDMEDSYNLCYFTTNKTPENTKLSSNVW